MASADEVWPGDLLEAGDPAFVDAIRRVHDAEALASFASEWLEDARPESRRLLLDYLDRPLNAFRHEGLVKRLFKKAEAAGDGAVMARFLVLFDRSIRRVRRRRRHWMQRVVTTDEERRALVAEWSALGYVSIDYYAARGRIHVRGIRVDEYLGGARNTTMPRGRMVEVKRWDARARAYATDLVPDWALALKIDWLDRPEKPDILQLPDALAKLEKSRRLFSVSTRHYLRRRAWRYFRKLGRSDPGRYVAAASEALALYRDEEMADGLALIDNWGLVHILFHHCPALVAKVSGWTTRPGRSLSELAPAPMFDPAWKGAPGAVVGLLSKARSRTVRRWAIHRIEADPDSHRPGLPLRGWVELLGHDDPEVVSLAASVLDGMGGLESLGVDDWLALVESTHPAALDVVCDLVGRFVTADRVTLDQAVRLAGLRPLPVARLGFSWLRARPLGEPAEFRAVRALVEAECGTLRPEILRWLRETLGAWPEVDASTALEFLDSRHADARAEGWAWFRSEPRFRDDVETWKKLLESPYDDVRLALVADLESRAGGDDPSKVDRALDPGVLRQLWAGVLLNVHRGNRAKPTVVRQLLRKLEASPDDAPALLPLLGVALRSVRGPERRAGLVAIVQLVEKRAEVEPLVRSSFPELQWT